MTCTAASATSGHRSARTGRLIWRAAIFCVLAVGRWSCSWSESRSRIVQTDLAVRLFDWPQRTRVTSTALTPALRSTRSVTISRASLVQASRLVEALEKQV